VSTVDGKVCVVTGSGSGIGRALALDLANRGARLALSDVNEASLAETVEQVKMVGAQVHSQLLDVADRDAVRAYADTDYTAYERILNVNLWGVIHGTKEFLPHLIASGDGHVVNISSLNGIMGQPSLSGYCASKFAVRGFTESLRAEMSTAGHPVKVSVVHPGGVKTNIATAAALEAEGAGVLTPDHAQRARRYNDKLLKMPAAQASKIIVDGVEAGKGRILVGNDARTIDVIVRSVPRWYPRLIAWWDRRQLASAS
jgi:NAD(P)-dependent dehydrogenase (short-subunit alcohol dehydrogenase family)